MEKNPFSYIIEGVIAIDKTKSLKEIQMTVLIHSLKPTDYDRSIAEIT